jgi:hypothetical protein
LSAAQAAAEIVFLQTAMFIAPFAASAVKTWILALGPVRAFACPQMHHQTINPMAMPNYSKK